MKYNKYLLVVLSILILLVFVSSVSAGDANTTDVLSVDESVNLENNLLSVDNNVATNELDNNTLKVSDDEILTEGNNWYVDSSKSSSGNGKSPEEAFKTLKEAIDSASDEDIINIASGKYEGSSNTGLTIDKNLTFIKYGNDEAIFDAKGKNGIWTVEATSINITGLTFKNGEAVNGGAIYFYDDIDNSNINATFIDNKAEGGNSGGGAIYIEGSFSGNITGSFSGNRAEYGGAICIVDSFYGNLNASFVSNTAMYLGGAICIYGSVCDNLTSTFSNNEAVYHDGGAIYIDDSVYGDLNSTFNNNKAGENGGALYIHQRVEGNLNSTFNNNNANKNGGAIYIYTGVYGNLTGTFTENKAKKGGAIHIYVAGVHGNLSGTYINNEAEDNGGAIYLDLSNIYHNVVGTFSDNKAKYGGAIYIHKGYSGNLGGTFNDNEAEYGGAIYINGTFSGNLTGTYLNNKAETSGGAIYLDNDNQDFVIQDCIFINNDNTIGVKSDNITAINCWFGNTATNYNMKPTNIGDVIINIWLFLNATANPSEIEMNKSSTVTFKLYAYENEVITPYDASKMNAKLELSQTLGELNQTVALIDEKITYTAKQKGDSSVTGEFERVQYTINLKNTVIHTNITINNATVNLHIDENVSSGATLNPSEAGDLTYTSSDPTIAIVENDIIKGLKEGKTTITVSFAGSDDYAPAENKTIEVTVKLKDASVSVNNSTLDLKLNDTFNLVATTSPEGLAVNFTSRNESIITVNDKGQVVAVGSGRTTITVSVGGDGEYALNSTTVDVNVKKDLNLSAVTFTLSKNVIIIVRGFENATGNVTITVGANNYTASIRMSIAFVFIPRLDKNITAHIYYSGDDNYSDASTTVDIPVKKDLNLTVTADPVIIGENATIIVTGLENATGNVSVIADNRFYTVPIINSTAIIVTSGLNNTTVAYILYLGDDKYNMAFTHINITVLPKPEAVINVENVTKYYKGPERFLVNITSYEGNPLANKTVNITINGITYTRLTDENGTTSIPLGLNSGQYNVTTKVENITANSTVTILSTVDGFDIIKIYRNATQYHATFLDTTGKYLADGTNVTFNINGVMYERKIEGSKGEARLNINLPQGGYIISAINPVNGEMHVNIITVLPTVVDNKDITKYYRNGTQYSVKLLGSDGKVVGAGENVTFNVNGIFYTRQTNASGIATLNINLPPNNYIITADYKGCRVANSITVLPVLNATDVEMKFGDGTQFKVNLVDDQGKPYAKQVIRFNINGVLYNRLTDNTGQAALNINLPIGEYIITSSYKESSIANKITITDWD